MPSAEEVLMATAGGAGEAPGDASTVFTYCVVDPDDEDATSPFLAFPEEAKGAGEILVLSDGGGNIKGWWSAKRSVAVTKQLQGITGASDEICVMFARLESTVVVKELAAAAGKIASVIIAAKPGMEEKAQERLWAPLHAYATRPPESAKEQRAEDAIALLSAVLDTCGRAGAQPPEKISDLSEVIQKLMVSAQLRGGRGSSKTLPLATSPDKTPSPAGAALSLSAATVHATALSLAGAAAASGFESTKLGEVTRGEDGQAVFLLTGGGAEVSNMSAMTCGAAFFPAQNAASATKSVLVDFLRPILTRMNPESDVSAAVKMLFGTNETMTEAAAVKMACAAVGQKLPGHTALEELSLFAGEVNRFAPGPVAAALSHLMTDTRMLVSDDLTSVQRRNADELYAKVIGQAMLTIQKVLRRQAASSTEVTEVMLKGGLIPEAVKGYIQRIMVTTLLMKDVMDKDKGTGKRGGDQNNTLEICKFYAKGNCRKGDACNKVHEGTGGANPIPTAAAAAAAGKKEPCRDHIRGNCQRGSRCSFSHDK
jgi:hypothetical protein